MISVETTHPPQPPSARQLPNPIRRGTAPQQRTPGIREEARRRPLSQAVPFAVGVSGGTITTAGTILAGAFAVLALAAGNQSGADQMRQIGYGIAAGVLMDTFLIRTLLVPAFATLLGRWNWWPSALYRQQFEDTPEASRDVA